MITMVQDNPLILGVSQRAVDVKPFRKQPQTVLATCFCLGWSRTGVGNIRCDDMPDADWPLRRSLTRSAKGIEQLVVLPKARQLGLVTRGGQKRGARLGVYRVAVGGGEVSIRGK